MKFKLPLLAIGLVALAGATPAHAATAKTSTLTTKYRNFDINGDNRIEINELGHLSFESASASIDTNAKVVLVLVEKRLLDLSATGGKHSKQDLVDRLKRMRGDLRAEGLTPRFMWADVYRGSVHQDGRTVLALRRVMKDLKAMFPKFQGAVLVGSFPEATLVRRWVWKRQNWKVTIAGTEYNCDSCPKSDFLRIVPEMISHRSDLVLADLDGKWENIYHAQKNLEAIEAIPKPNMSWLVNGGTFISFKYNRRTESFQDFFWIKDDNYQILPGGKGNELRVRTYTALQHPELSNADKSRPNPMARPDIFISRINAYNVARSPDPSFRDRTNKGFLDANGKPRTVYTNSPIDPKSKLIYDAALERDLIVDYLDRNHAFRVGGNPTNAHRTASVSHGDGLESASGMNSYLRKSASNYSSSWGKSNADVREYVDFLKQPAVLKGVIAHSSEWNSSFDNQYNSSGLSQDVGGNPWRWRKSSSGNTYVPSFMEQGGAADAYLYRTIYENGLLDDIGGSLFIHNGCRVNSPGYAATRPYSSKGYASTSGFQNAESLMLFTNAVGLAARAKVFYDKPRGMPEAMKTGHFGDGWVAYFTKEAADSSLKTNVSGSKRAYTWSLLGDFTLNVRAKNGLGIIGARQWQVKDLAVHPNNAWVGGWNFDNAAGIVRGTGKFSSTSRDEFVITSNWGIGILYFDGNEWRSRVTKPNNTWFGQWRYNASNNSGKDKIQGVGDFDGDGKDEILVTSSWGIGILKRSGSSMTSLVAKPKNTRFGEWMYRSTDKIAGVGDFNGDGKADIVVRSSWGLGILTRQGNSLTTVMLKPKETSLGGWKYRPTDVIEGIGDTDGDGKDEIIIRSTWGMGILRLQGSSMTASVIKPKDTWFGQWRYNPRDNRVRAIADFNGDGKDDIVVTSPWGIGILKRSGNSLTSLVAKPKDTWFGQWRYNAKTNKGSDVILAAADLSGNGRAELVLRSSWGTGILRLAGSSLTTVYAKPHGNRVGAWHMSAQQKLVGIGNFDGQPGDDILFEAR